MTQDIKFQGLSSSPSDYDAQDGELGTLLNLVNEDGALKPIHQPIVTDSNITIPDGATVELVHKVTHENTIHSHYIIRRADDTWCWTEKDGDGSFTDIDLDGFHANAVTAVGNILNFVGDTNIMYAYWKASVYKKIDLSNLRFSGTLTVQANPMDYDNIHPLDSNILDITRTYDSEGYPEYIKANETLEAKYVQDIFETKDAYLNAKMDDKSFKYITFGVLAVRMYDGSYYQIGNPFIITGGSGIDNDIYILHHYKGVSTSVYTFGAGQEYVGCLRQTYYNANLSVTCDNWEKYKDILDGIDVFVSDSIFPYDTEKNIIQKQDALKPANVTDKTVVSLELETGTTAFVSIWGTGEPYAYTAHWNFPPLEYSELRKKIDNLIFYKSTSFTFDDIINTKTKALNRIYQTEETISLANNNQQHFGAKVAITYNNRLHLGNVSTIYDIMSNGSIYNTYNEDKWTFLIKVCYEHNGNEIYSYELLDHVGYLNIFSFYVDNVKSFDVYAYDNYSEVKTYLHMSLTLYPIETLGLSIGLNYYNAILHEFSYDNFESSSEEEWNSIMSEMKSRQGIYSNSPNLVKVSEAENPLVFPAKNSVQVGSSIINALAANTRPISEGQFGEAPLYAFTDEGVWTLMTSSEGTYEARQPANREICTNPKSILQIDDAVLFTTERGIMLQNGKNAECITNVLDGYPFDFTQLYKEDFSKKVLAVGNISEEAVKYVRFHGYLQSADMIYDYYDNRIIVFNPAYPYAYVYSLKSKTWSTMANTINKRVNIYPESYGVNKDGKIVDVYVKEPADSVPYFLCSRPLGLGTPEVFKTMFTAITRGYFRGTEAGKCGMVLYGSNDLFHWYLIKSSVDKYLRGMMGSPYKYFRIALIGSLLPDESITGMSADFTERWQNKLR